MHPTPKRRLHPEVVALRLGLACSIIVVVGLTFWMTRRNGDALPANDLSPSTIGAIALATMALTIGLPLARCGLRRWVEQTEAEAMAPVRRLLADGQIDAGGPDWLRACAEAYEDLARRTPVRFVSAMRAVARANAAISRERARALEDLLSANREAFLHPNPGMAFPLHLATRLEASIERFEARREATASYLAFFENYAERFNELLHEHGAPPAARRRVVARFRAETHPVVDEAACAEAGARLAAAEVAILRHFEAGRRLWRWNTDEHSLSVDDEDFLRRWDTLTNEARRAHQSLLYRTGEITAPDQPGEALVA